jgi:thioredoxin reductase (NADPH)
MTDALNTDLLIIGAGPAGLAAAVEAQRAGISNLLVVEKGPSHSQMIRTYYKEHKRVDAQYAGVEALCIGVLCLRDGDRESYLAMMDHVIEISRIPVQYNSEIWSVTSAPAGDVFEIKTTSGLEYRAKFVIVAIGKMGRPRQPDYYRGIPASLKNDKRIIFDINARSFDGAKVLVVGGGDSAAEYAEMLSTKNEVTLSYRQPRFTRLNSINEKIMDEMIAGKRIRVLMPSNILKIAEEGGLPAVTFAEAEYPREIFDAVLFGLGGMTPVAFLQTAGVQLDSTAEPLTNETHESSVPKLYIVGDLLGHRHGGGSIIGGFNSASRAVRHLLDHHLKRPLPPEMVWLDHLQFAPGIPWTTDRARSPGGPP